MKLGRDTGSLTNYLMSGTKGQPKPEVGMGATILSWSDRTAATIVEVLKGGKVIVIQEDHARRTDKNGMSECQDYEYSPNPSAYRQYYKMNKGGAYYGARINEKGRVVFEPSPWRLCIGDRDAYFDFSF